MANLILPVLLCLGFGPRHAAFREIDLPVRNAGAVHVYHRGRRVDGDRDAVTVEPPFVYFIAARERDDSLQLFLVVFRTDGRRGHICLKVKLSGAQSSMPRHGPWRKSAAEGPNVGDRS